MASDCTGAYFPQPIAKKSPTGTSTDGDVSPSQYIRRMENRQLPVGVIQICWIDPCPEMSARVNVSPGLMITKGFTFHPRPRSRAASDATPSVAIPPLPFSPVKFSGLTEKVFASEVRKILLSPFARPS